MSFGEYEVTGDREYRGHGKGEVFDARLEPNAEARAIARGDVRLIRHYEPSLCVGSYTFPHGWLTADDRKPQQGRGRA